MDKTIKDMNDLKDSIYELIVLFLFKVIRVLAAGFFVCLFWNLVIPIILIGIGPLIYWQGVGLVLLFDFLFIEVGGSKDR